MPVFPKVASVVIGMEFYHEFYILVGSMMFSSPPFTWLFAQPWWPTHQPLSSTLIIRFLLTLTVVLALTAGYCWVGWQGQERKTEAYKQRWLQTQPQLDAQLQPR